MASQQRPTFTKAQITGYFDRIKLPAKYHKYTVANESPGETLKFLACLQKYHLAEVPFENLTLHYSHHRQISINAHHLYKKIVEDKNGRGGYCMENNCIFGTLLRSLGFDIYSAGARVYEGIEWAGWSHMVNIIRIGNDRYHVDVGFGSNGPTRPLQLDRSSAVYRDIYPSSVRLQWRNIDANTDANQRLWVYEHRQDDQSDFQQMYCFTELEFLPADYNLMNYYTSTSPKTFFTQLVVCEKKELGGETNEEIVGQIILGKSVKWRIRGQKYREEQFESEDDRVKALDVVFGIKLSQLDRESIHGLVSEIKKE